MLQTEIAPLNILNLNYFHSYQAYQTSNLIEIETLKQNLQVACQGPLCLCGRGSEAFSSSP